MCVCEYVQERVGFKLKVRVVVGGSRVNVRGEGKVLQEVKIGIYSSWIICASRV